MNVLYITNGLLVFIDRTSYLARALSVLTMSEVLQFVAKHGRACGRDDLVTFFWLSSSVIYLSSKRDLSAEFYAG